VSLTRLQYRLARKEGGQFLAWGDRYATKRTAREAAPAVNGERRFAGLAPVDYILTLPCSGSDSLDPSHFLSAEPI
jgi:hypothetical protein